MTDEPLTPVGVERMLNRIGRDLTLAQAMLRDARDEEVKAKHVFERTHRRALLSSECPRVTRGGVTTAERDAWVDEQCTPVREAYELAEVKRRAAEDHLKVLVQQGTLAATLAKSVGQAYRMAGVAE